MRVRLLSYDVPCSGALQAFLDKPAGQSSHGNSKAFAFMIQRGDEVAPKLRRVVFRLHPLQRVVSAKLWPSI
jgi:hypothetical protein